MKARRKSKTIVERSSVGYCRVSTEEQATSGVSLAAQEARIGAYCAAMGFDAVSIVADRGASAKSLERPVLGTILGRVRAGEIGTVVVLKLDRLTRSVRDLADLLDLFAKHDVALVSVCEHLDTSSAAGRLVLNVMATVGQWEREACAERTATALAHKRRNGVVYGSTPFGYQRRGNALVPDPERADCSAGGASDGSRRRVLPGDRGDADRTRRQTEARRRNLVRFLRESDAALADRR